VKKLVMIYYEIREGEQKKEAATSQC